MENGNITASRTIGSIDYLALEAKKASELFARYLHRALPVSDDTGKILGLLLYRDVVALRHRYVE